MLVFFINKRKMEVANMFVDVVYFPLLTVEWISSCLSWERILITIANSLSWNDRPANALLWFLQPIEAEWHIYASITYAIIDSDNGLSPVRRQAIIWNNAGILLIGPVGTTLSEILIYIQTFSFKNIHSQVSSVKWRPFRLGLNALIWRHDERGGVSNHQHLDCLFNHLFRWRSKKTSKLRDTGLC